MQDLENTLTWVLGLLKSNKLFGVLKFNAMAGHISTWAFVGISVIALLTACEEESKIDKHSLEGRWEIIKGLRNQTETETLSGTYFLFEGNRKMMTNLPVGPEELTDFEVAKDKIHQKSSPIIEYQILELTDTSLILGLELRGMQFEMHFMRAKQEQPASDPLNVFPQNQRDSIPQAADTTAF